VEVAGEDLKDKNPAGQVGTLAEDRPAIDRHPWRGCGQRQGSWPPAAGTEPAASQDEDL